MPADPVLWNLDERGVATVTLNRPEVNNAYDGGLIQCQVVLGGDGGLSLGGAGAVGACRWRRLPRLRRMW